MAKNQGGYGKGVSLREAASASYDSQTGRSHSSLVESGQAAIPGSADYAYHFEPYGSETPVGTPSWHQIDKRRSQVKTGKRSA